MYPVSGGTARFPHLAYGSVAGISFGFFSWVQAVTVAPIECFAVMQYGSYYWHGLFNATANGGKGNVTGLGFAMTVVLLIDLHRAELPGHAPVQQGQRGHHLVEGGHPGPHHHRAAVQVPRRQLQLATASCPTGSRPCSGRSRPRASCSPTSASSRPTSWPREIKNPQKNLPRAILLATGIGIVIYVMLQVVFIGAMPASQLTHGWAGISNTDILAGPFAGLAGIVGLGWLAIILRIDAFISPFGTGLMYQTSTSRVGYGLGRNRYFPQVFTRVDRNGVPWISLIVAFVAGLVFLLPFPSWHSLVGLVTSASVLMYAGAPLAMGAFRRQVPDADRPYRVPVGEVWSPLAFIIANMLIYWSGFETVWKLGIVIIIGYVLIAIFMAFDENRPPLDWKSAQWLPVYLIGMGIISWQGQYSAGRDGAAGHRPDPVLVGHAGRGRVQPGHLLLGDGHPAAQAEMLNLVERQSGIEPPERSAA